MNTNPSLHLQPDERLSEIGEILALGLVRLRLRQSSEQAEEGGDSSLDCLAGRSGHASLQREKTG